MRNAVAQALPPKATMTIEIDPPMAEGEEPYLLTLRGPGTVVIQATAPNRVALYNPTSEISPFILVVAKVMPPALHSLVATLLRKLHP
jgi:hypothetical protein